MILRRNVFKGVLLSGFFVAVLPAVASASVIYTNFGPSMAYDITQGNPVGNDFAGDNAAQGDSFTPGANAAFGSVSVALSCVVACPASENFTIALDKDNSDAPGAVIESFSFVTTTLGGLGLNNPVITATSILHPSLNAGTRYWITVSSSANFAISWNNNSTGDTSDQAVSSDGGATWFSPSGATPSAFQVNSFVSTAVPEPSSAALFVAGLTIFVSAFQAKRPRRG